MRFAIIFLCTLAAYGQSERVLRFRQPDAGAGTAEVAVLIRTLTDKAQLSVDQEGAFLKLRGTDESIAIGEWLFQELDRQPLAPKSPEALSEEFAVPGSLGETMAVFYPLHARPPEDALRIANVVRGISRVELLVSFSDGRAMVMRGTTERIKRAEWLLAGLERPPGTAESDTMIMPSNGKEDVARVFYASHHHGGAPLIEIVRAIQNIGDAPMASPSRPPDAILVQAPAGRVELAAWLFHELDQPPTDRESTPQEYKLSDVEDNVVTIFYIPSAGSEAELREFANSKLRSATRVLRQQLVPSLGAVVMRGTPEQTALAGRIIREKETGIALPPPPVPTAFDVASVKPSAHPEENPIQKTHPDGLDLRNVTLMTYIGSAYTLRFHQISGPSWIATEKYDLSAKASAPVSTQQLWAMLQPVLVRRFHLTTHRETKVLDGYSLVIAKSGLKMHPVPKDGEPLVQ